MTGKRSSLLRGSIATGTLLSLAIRISLVIVLMTGITYFHVISVITDESLEKLTKYVAERGESGRMIFKLALDNQAVLKGELLKRLEQAEDADPKARFDQVLTRFPDGVVRNRLEGFDGTQQPFVYVGKQVHVDADLRRRVMTFYDLSLEYGRAWSHRLQNIYFTTPENLLVGYWPEFPNWAHDADADLYMPDEEYVYIADKKNNPYRKPAWTGLFYDVVGKSWMVSLETPVDYQGRHVATIGHDILLNELLQRTLNERLKGSYNLIFRKDGRLIAHPDKLEDIKQQQGLYDIHHSDDPELKTIYQLVSRSGLEHSILQNPVNDDYLAVSFFPETEWYFVTVYPKALLQESAYSTARLILILGVVSLLLELMIFFFVLRKQVSNPLQEVTHAVEAIYNGDYETRLDDTRADELGQIGAAFNDMVHKIQQRTAALQESEERQRRVFDATNDGVWDWNILTREAYLSPRWKAILGYQDDELDNVEDTFFSRIHPEDHERLSVALAHHFEQAGPFYLEIRLKHKDGDYRWILSRGEAVWDDSGKPVRMLGTISDISQRKQTEKALIESEARLRRAESLAHTGYYEFDADGENFIGSDELKRIFGFEPQSDFVFTEYGKRIHPEDSDRIFAELAEATQAQRGLDLEYRIIHPDGREVTVHSVAEIMPGAAGRPPRYFGSLIDITQQKQTEQELVRHQNLLEELVAARTKALADSNDKLMSSMLELQQTQDYLVQSEKMASLGGLVAGVAHEINTPVGVGVTAISHFEMKLADYAQRYENDQLTREDFEKLLKLSENTTRMVHQNLIRAANLIRSFKQVAVDQTSNEFREFNLKEYLEEILQSLHPKLKKGGHLAAIDCPEDITLFSHPGALSQIITNLVINSIIHGFEDKKRGQIAIHVTPQSDDMIRIQFSDNGKGIASQYLDKIFDPFFTTARSKGGSGLGMHIVYNLVTRTLNGTLDCTSLMGEGTVFIIDIPCRGAESHAHGLSTAKPTSGFVPLEGYPS